MMKKTVIYILSIFLIFIAACSNDEDKGFIQGVINLKTQPTENSITLLWDYPENETISYIDIEYSYSTEKNSIRHESTGSTPGQVTILVANENKEDVFYFTLTAWNASGARSYPVTIKSKVLSTDIESRMNELLESIEMEPITRGAKIKWDNTLNLTCQIKVSYTQSGKNGIAYFDALTTHYESVVEGLNPSEVSFVVEVVNTIDGIYSSSNREFTLTPFSTYKLPKNTWSIVSFSSQRAESGDGSAACLIDGTNETSWWAGSSGAPQWVIIDLGAVAAIERVSLQRTVGNNAYTSWDMLYSFDYTPDPAEWMYECDYYNTHEDVDSRIEFNRNYDGEQVYPLKQTVQARYIKVTGTRISGGYTVHFGEFFVYGSYVD